LGIVLLGIVLFGIVLLGIVLLLSFVLLLGVDRGFFIVVCGLINLILDWVVTGVLFREIGGGIGIAGDGFLFGGFVCCEVFTTCRV
jgi:hypothetical protein